MRLYGTTLKAASGKVIFRLSSPDNYFHGCVMLTGETKADFGEIPELEKETTQDYES